MLTIVVICDRIQKSRSRDDTINIDSPSAVNPSYDRHTMNSNRISVRIETIRYGDTELNVAIAVSNPKRLFLTFPTAESILNYSSDSFRKKIASKSLKSALGMDLVLVKFTGTIVNKVGDGTPTVSMIEFEDFVKVVAWEASINQNPIAFQLLVAGFADSFRSLAYEQMGIRLEVDERIESISKYLGRYHKLFDWDIERDLHHRLSLYRLHGEWFSESAYDQIDLVKFRAK